MTEFYFQKFPIITYNNYTTRNITERVALIHQDKVNSEGLTPVEISDTMRADVLAYNAYGDSWLDWMIWLNNNDVDPYYDWHLNADEFNAYLNDKYGSWMWAQELIAYWRLAWPTDDYQIDAGYYNTNLPGVLKKYYSPVWGSGSTILYYVRNLQDWRVTTNQMISFDITMKAANTSFAANDVIQIYQGGFVNGQFQSIMANSSVIIGQHVTGNTNAPATLVSVSNTQLSANASNVTILQTNIDLAEIVYWEGVSYYEIEAERNAKNKYPLMIDPSNVMNISSQITAELKE